MIQFKCPSCKTLLEVPFERAGSTVGCPKCKQTMRVPLPTATIVSDDRFSAVPMPPPIQHQPSPAPPYIPDKKSAGLAVLLSFFWPGLGQVYNGHIGKALLMMLFALILLLGCSFFPGVVAKNMTDPKEYEGRVAQLTIGAGIAYLFFFLWNLFDAYNSAEDINDSHRRRYGSS